MASAEMAFSADGTRATMFFLSPILAAAAMVARTEDPPDISRCMSCILPLGFTLSPPVSEVIPFPTSTIGAKDLALLAVGLPAPQYSAIMSLVSLLVPCPTANNAPILSFLSSFSPSTVTVILVPLARLLAASARSVGVMSQAGVLAMSRALLVYSPTISPRLRPVVSSADNLPQRSTSVNLLDLSFLVL